MRFFYCVMSSESVQLTGFEFPRQDPLAAPTVHQQIEGEVLDEVVHLVTKTLSVKGVKHGVTGPIGDRAGSTCQAAFSEFQGLAAEGTLVDPTVILAAKRTT